MASDIQPADTTDSTTRDTPDPVESETISVSFTLPAWAASEAGLDAASLDDTAREAFLVNLYREDHITHHQLGEALGLSRLEVQGVLKRHRVSSGPDWEQLRDEIGSLRGVRPE